MAFDRRDFLLVLVDSQAIFRPTPSHRIAVPFSQPMSRGARTQARIRHASDANKMCHLSKVVLL